MTKSSRIRLDRLEPDRINPGAALLLFGAIVAGFIKLILPQSATGLRWEYLYLMVATAAVLVLDSIRSAIAAAFGGPPSPIAWQGSNKNVGLTVGPASSQKSEKSGGGTETWMPRRSERPAQ